METSELAFESWYRIHGGRVTGALVVAAGHRQDAEDAAAAAWEDVLASVVQLSVGDGDLTSLQRFAQLAATRLHEIVDTTPEERGDRSRR